jgi:hypothetical protein
MLDNNMSSLENILLTSKLTSLKLHQLFDSTTIFSLQIKILKKCEYYNLI